MEHNAPLHQRQIIIICSRLHRSLHPNIKSTVQWQMFTIVYLTNKHVHVVAIIGQLTQWIILMVQSNCQLLSIGWLSPTFTVDDYSMVSTDGHIRNWIHRMNTINIVNNIIYLAKKQYSDKNSALRKCFTWQTNKQIYIKYINNIITFGPVSRLSFHNYEWHIAYDFM